MMSEDAQVERDASPDVLTSGRVPSRDIRVEQVRTLQERLALRPLEGTRKVALLLQADAR